jgi:DNA-directed RNA polymerase specialized sigma24 family protein
MLELPLVIFQCSAGVKNTNETRVAQMNDDLANQKLDRALRLLAAIATRGLSQTDQIALLDRAGFAPKEIAEIVGTTSNTVRVSLVSIRRATTQGKRKRPAAGSQEGEE